MNPEIKTRWVEALRSGEYEQGTGALKNGDGQFCCLGVLCDVVEPEGWFNAFGHKGNLHNGYGGTPSSPFLEMVQIPMTVHTPAFFTPDGNVFTSPISALTHLNDREGQSFPAIADWIEENL